MSAGESVLADRRTIVWKGAFLRGEYPADFGNLVLPSRRWPFRVFASGMGWKYHHKYSPLPNDRGRWLREARASSGLRERPAGYMDSVRGHPSVYFNLVGGRAPPSPASLKGLMGSRRTAFRADLEIIASILGMAIDCANPVRRPISHVVKNSHRRRPCDSGVNAARRDSYLTAPGNIRISRRKPPMTSETYWYVMDAQEAIWKCNGGRLGLRFANTTEGANRFRSFLFYQRPKKSKKSSVCRLSAQRYQWYGGVLRDVHISGRQVQTPRMFRQNTGCNQQV